MKRHDQPYRLLVALVSVQVAYGIFWALHDISARLGLWPDADAAHAFVVSLNAPQEVFFFGHVVMNAGVLLCVLRRRWIALPAFILSFLLDRADWVMMSNNVVFTNMVPVDAWAVFSFALQGVIVALSAVLVFEGVLK